MVRISAAATLALMAATAPADAIDLKDLTPCRSAAVRLCDRSQGTDAAALWKCGATLASRRQDVGPRCVEVLIRYGQLSR